MLEVNLSRAHSMIKVYAEKLRFRREELEKSRKSFAFSILATTTDKDLREFQERIEKRKAKNDAILEECLKIQAYIAYLKKTIEDGNVNFGIGAKLLKAAYLSREIDLLTDYREMARMGLDPSPEPIKDTDYYKTSFTENNKVYSLSLYMYDESDMDQISSRIAELKNELVAANDEIASLNQTKVAKIKEFDEFQKKDFDAE